MIIIPGYEIREEIYEGTKSIVYRGIRHQNNQPIILKVLKAQYPTPTDIAKFKHEYEITKNLQLEGIVKPLGLENCPNGLALILEDFGGESLHQLLTSRTIDLVGFLNIAIRLADTLGSLHQNNIIHKDIKPSNIIINSKEFKVKITDFSISSRLDRENQTLGNPNLLEGTLAYMSPEQTGRMNRSIDYRTDFYSLGVTFYEMLTGELPFPVTDPMELVHCHIAKRPVPIHQLNQEIPSPISDIVTKLLSKTAEERYQNALGLKADLEICLRRLQNNGKIENFALGKQDISDKFQIPQKLYGRDTEIASLMAAFERVSQGTTEMMLVFGYSGIGKSALVHEIHKPIVRQRGYFIAGKFDQFKRNIPYASLIQAFQELIRQLLTENDQQIQAWKEKLLAALSSNGQIIIDVIPEVELIIGQQPAVPRLGSTESQNRFNLVFQKFISVFAQKEHPLVLFLDDLQWADSASLKLIRLLMTDSDSQYLLMIGAYRDNEVDATHLLIQTVNEIQKSGAGVSTISLRHLDSHHANQLIADTLRCSLERSQPLAELVFAKTHGNPFFLTQLLKAIYQDNLLSFDFSKGSWQWDIEQIQEMGITDNVIELMVGKIQKLDQKTQHILKLAACIGNRFDLDILSLVNEKSLSATAEQLWAALQSGLVLPLSEAYKFPLVHDEEAMPAISNPAQSRISYKFLHDRVQQAAYSLIPDSQKPAIHLKVGQLLLKSTNSQDLEEKIFDIVNQLNIGAELTRQQIERDEIARLNLLAGKKAKAATAYEAAVRYLRVGLDLLASDTWQHNYELALNLYLETIEAEYLNSNVERASKLSDVALKQAQTLLDKVKLYDLKIKFYISQNEMQPALETGIQVLEMLEIPLEQEPPTLLLIEDLFKLPRMTDPYKIAAMQILSTITAPAFIANPTLAPPIILTMIRLSSQYGNSIPAIYAYGLYGLLLCAGIADIDSGYKFGQLALRLLEEFDAKEIKCRVYHLFGICISHWKEHARESIPLLYEAVQIGLETGDIEYVGYATLFLSQNLFFLGQELEQVTYQQAQYIDLIKKFKSEFTLNCIKIYRQTALNLLNKSANRYCLIGESFNEAELLPQFIENNSIQLLFYVYSTKLTLSYLFKKYDFSLENARLAEKYAEPIVSMIVYVEYIFYYSLALLAQYSKVAQTEQLQFMAIVRENQEKMRQWAEHSPANYRHKYELIEAERNRVLGQKYQAMEYYDQAIQSAREQGYIQNEAIANELAAEFYLTLGRDKLARLYMAEAHYSYGRWGATAKVKDLESRYPQLLSGGSAETTTGLKTTKTTSTSGGNAQVLDLTTVMKASQALAAEIVLEKLLAKLLKIVMENAGAQTGCLILEQDGQLLIEAKGAVDNEEVKVRQSMPIETSQQLPVSVINYVERTRENVVLTDAAREGRFTTDAYIAKNNSKSILCTPIIHQGKLIGLFYLENNLTAGAFTPDRLEVLNLLSSQAAISIENAKLYEGMKALNEALRESERRQAQILESIPVGVFVMDSTGKPYYTNQAAQEILGKGILPEADPDQLADIYHIYIAGTDRICPNADLPGVRALRGERITTDALEVHHPDKVVPLEVWGNPIFDEKGTVVYAIAAFQNITERKQAEVERIQFTQELEQKNAALQRLDRLKDEFLANTSHELRTPLNGIIGIAESMVDGATGALTDRQIANLSMIISSGRRLSSLVNDILDFSKLKNRDIQLQRKPVDFRQIVEVVLTVCQPLFAGKSLELKNEIPEELPAVDGDENRLQQIMYNLIDNAIKFTESGSITVSAIALTDSMVEVTVADTGIGIPSDKLTDIFKSFEQVDTSISREYGGTGLGLSITKQLVELHGGTIRVAAKLGEGSQFMFTLPITTATLEPTPHIHQRLTKVRDYPVPSLVASSSLVPSQGEFIILAVDDEPINLQVLANHLSLQNYAIIQAKNGMEALAFIQNGLRPDLIILDVMMPRMSGYEVCKKIREQFPAHEMPIVMLTAKNQVSDLVEGLGAGANDYLTKPISKNELLARIKTHIELSKINLAYGRFVPHEFLRFLGHDSIVNVHLGDQIQKEMSILFSDIRSFTSLSEEMSPKENFDFINSYLKRVGPVIRQHNGFIDKYIGDAIMALFPEAAEDALGAAIAMQKQVALYNDYRQANGYPPIAIGIGLHTGSLMLGTIGEEQRMESTVISDAVNLASRLEGLTKLYGASIIISGETLFSLDDQTQYNYRFLGQVPVKGKRDLVPVFDVFDAEPSQMVELKRQTKAKFEEGLILYHQKKFEEACQIFQTVIQLNDQDKAAKIYIKSCQDFLTQNNSENGTLVETFDAQLESSDTNTLLL